jgi:hypothetical protein
MPEHIAENRSARFYPPTVASKIEPFLEIQYELPLTEPLKLVLKYGVKFLEALSPLIGVLLANLARRRRIRLFFIGLTIFSYFCLFLTVFIFARDVGEIGNDAIVDFILLGMSGLVALVSLRFKSEEQGAPTTVMLDSIPRLNGVLAG